MKLEAKNNMGKRQNGYIIPLASVNVSVGQMNLVESEIKRGFPSMRRIHKCDDKTQNPINMPTWCEHCGRMVAADELIKGYETDKDKYIYLTNAEVEEAKTRFESKTMEVICISPIENLAPHNILESHLLVPVNDSKSKKKTKDAELNEKFYAMLSNTLLTEKLFIIGKVFSSRGENFIAITGTDIGGKPMLIQYNLYYADEMRNPTTSGYEAPELADNEKAVMNTLIGKLRVKLKDTNFKSITSKLTEVFDEKIRNKTAGTVPDASATPQEPVAQKVVDAVAEMEKAMMGI